MPRAQGTLWGSHCVGCSRINDVHLPPSPRHQVLYNLAKCCWTNNCCHLSLPIPRAVSWRPSTCCTSQATTGKAKARGPPHEEGTDDAPEPSGLNPGGGITQALRTHPLCWLGKQMARTQPAVLSSTAPNRDNLEPRPASDRQSIPWQCIPAACPPVLCPPRSTAPANIYPPRSGVYKAQLISVCKAATSLCRAGWQRCSGTA